MSIASEITRLQNAKASIKTSIEAKGVTVPSSAKLDDYSDYVDQIQTGGGTSKLPQAINNTITSLTVDDFDNDTEISDYKFMGCTSLTSVTIPTTITRIGHLAFWYCTALTSITYQGTTTQWNAIEFGNLWSYLSGVATIHCTDNDITLITDYLNYGEAGIYNYEQQYMPFNVIVPSENRSSVFSINGEDVWWNGQELQCNQFIINPKSFTKIWKINCKTSKSLFEHNGGIYMVENGVESLKRIYKYDAASSHADSSRDHWTELVGVTQPLTGTLNVVNTMCKLGNDIYMGDVTNTTYNNLYKWVDETTGFDSTPVTLSLPANEFRTWNIWTPDGQHYFLSGSHVTSSSATISKKTYLWNATDKTFDLWAENYSICFTGMTTFEYNGNIYCYGTTSNYGNGNRYYKIDINYTNKTFTFTDVDSQFIKIYGPTYVNNHWDFKGCRNLCSTYKPRKTN